MNVLKKSTEHKINLIERKMWNLYKQSIGDEFHQASKLQKRGFEIQVAICMKNEKINTKVCGFEFVFFLQNNFERFVEVCIVRIHRCVWMVDEYLKG